MSWERTSVLLLVVIALAAFYFVKIKRPSENAFSLATEAAKSRILSLSENETITGISLSDAAKGTKLSLSRSKDQSWRLVEPIDYPAESVVVDGLVSLLKLYPRIRSLSFEGLSLQEFGFDAPRLSICVVTDLKADERCLVIGSDAAVAQGAYAKWNNEAKYFLVDSQFITAFDKTLYSLRKKQIFTPLENDITLIQFRTAKSEFEIKHQGKEWMLEKPSKAIIGNDMMNELLLHLNNVFVKEFLDTARAENRKLGLQPGERLIRVAFQDGLEQKLIQGKESPGRDAYYALGEDGKTVFLVSLGKLDKIDQVFRKLIS